MSAGGRGAELSTSTSLCVDQYVRVSLRVLEERKKEAAAARASTREALAESSSVVCSVSSAVTPAEAAPVVVIQDVFSRAGELLDVPLNSQAARMCERLAPSEDEQREEGRLAALARLARDDPMLIRIKFCHDRVDDEWATATAHAIGFNTMVESVVVVGNRLTDAGCVALANAAAVHPAIAVLSMGGNSMGDRTADAVAGALEQSSALLVVNLTNVKFHLPYYQAHVKFARRRDLRTAYSLGLASARHFSERDLTGANDMTPARGAQLQGRLLVHREGRSAPRGGGRRGLSSPPWDDDHMPALALLPVSSSSSSEGVLFADKKAGSSPRPGLSLHTSSVIDSPAQRGGALTHWSKARRSIGAARHLLSSVATKSTTLKAKIAEIREVEEEDGTLPTVDNAALLRMEDPAIDFDPKEWGKSAVLVDVVQERISPQGVARIAAALPQSRLIELDLGGQRCGDAGAIALAQAICAAESALVYLNVDGNEISDDGVVALASAFLAPLSRMKCLSLRMNQATCAAAEQIADLSVNVGSHQHHVALDLSLNQIGKRGCVALEGVYFVCLLMNPGATVQHDDDDDDDDDHHPTRNREDTSRSLMEDSTTWRRRAMSAKSWALSRRVGRRPVRLGGTTHTDTTRNLLHLRAASADGGSVPRGSVLRTVARASTARSDREARGRSRVYRSHKANALNDRGLRRFTADPSLPPIDFATTFAATTRDNRAALKARDYQAARYGKTAGAPPPIQRAHDPLRTTRVGRFLNHVFPAVVGEKGALQGRIDIDKKAPPKEFIAPLPRVAPKKQQRASNRDAPSSSSSAT